MGVLKRTAAKVWLCACVLPRFLLAAMIALSIYPCVVFHLALTSSASKKRGSDRQRKAEVSHVRRARRGYLMTMNELIGQADARLWRAQFRGVLIASCDVKLARRPFLRLWAKTFFWLTSFTELRLLFRYVLANGIIARTVSVMTAQHGWRDGDAEAYMLLGLVSDVLGQAMREGNVAFSASCHALSNALARAVALASTSGAGAVAPPLYLAMQVGQVSKKGAVTDLGLEDVEPSLSGESVVEPDATGFRGQVCFAPPRFLDDPRKLDRDGYLARHVDVSNLGTKIVRRRPTETRRRLLRLQGGGRARLKPPPETAA